MESDLISRKSVVADICAERDKILDAKPSKHGQAMRGGIRKALHCVETAPAVDAVEVVRCRECARRGDPEKCPMCYHYISEWYPRDNTDDEGFCHMGVKKDAVD